MDGKSSTLIVCLTIVVVALVWAWGPGSRGGADVATLRDEVQHLRTSLDLATLGRQELERDLDRERSSAWALREELAGTQNRQEQAGSKTDSARESDTAELQELRAQVQRLAAAVEASDAQRLASTSDGARRGMDARRIAELERSLEDAEARAKTGASTSGLLVERVQELEQYAEFLEGARDDPDTGFELGAPFRARTESLADDVAPAVGGALDWLAAAQEDDGRWRADEAHHDVGVSGMALLAFLGAGQTLDTGAYTDQVTRAVAWLRQQQDRETGLFGSRISHDFLYGHAIATLAMCEAYAFSRSPLLKRSAQRGINYILRARNPYGAWRYDVPPIGDNDTSITSWMLSALYTARQVGLQVDNQAFQGAQSWIDEVTDPDTGRVGYDTMGSLSSRTIANQNVSRDRAEAMTGAGLFCRFLVGQDPEEVPIMRRHAELLARKPPAWEPDEGSCDMIYWFFGTQAMRQMGGDTWDAWYAALREATLSSQRATGDEAGSWDPVGPWTRGVGRVLATALVTLSLTAPIRYEVLAEGR